MVVYTHHLTIVVILLYKRDIRMATSNGRPNEPMPSIIYDPDKMTMTEMKNWASSKEEPSLNTGRVGWATIVGGVIAATIVIVLIVYYTKSTKKKPKVDTDSDDEESEIVRHSNRKRNRRRDDVQPQIQAPLQQQVLGNN